MKVLASLSILLALLAVSQATAETRSVTIGKFTYLGTGTQTRSDGTIIQGVSSYELVFDTGGVTAEPIPFSNAILFVKGSSQGTQSSGFPTITTGNGCGQNDSFPPCDLIFEGGPSSAGFQLAPCALQDNVTQTCTVIDNRGKCWAQHHPIPSGKAFRSFAPDGGRADALIFIMRASSTQRWIIRCQLARTMATITESGIPGC